MASYSTSSPSVHDTLHVPIAAVQQTPLAGTSHLNTRTPSLNCTNRNTVTSENAMRFQRALRQPLPQLGMQSILLPLEIQLRLSGTQLTRNIRHSHHLHNTSTPPSTHPNTTTHSLVYYDPSTPQATAGSSTPSPTAFHIHMLDIPSPCLDRQTTTHRTHLHQNHHQHTHSNVQSLP